MTSLPKNGRRHHNLQNISADLQSNEFRRITQEELNDLVRDLDLPMCKCKAEL